MMEARLLKLPSGKISNDTAFLMDDDDRMARLRHLMQVKEDLKNEIEKSALEADEWLQILETSSSTELEDLMLSLPSTAPMTIEHQGILKEYCQLSTQLQAYSFHETTAAYMTAEGNLLLKFLRPSFKSQYSTLLILLTKGADNTYRVGHHNMPDTVAVAGCEEEYLKNGEKNEGVKKFITAITQYTNALYLRQDQIVTLQKAEFLNKMQVYHNQGCTFLSFMVEVKNEDEEITYEFTLDFYPRDILPYRVKASHIDGATPSLSLADIMQDMAVDMKVVPFPQVLYLTFGGQVSDRSTPEDTSDSNNSGSTVLFAE
ncbi:uncharacterized protein LOC121869040 [Homarus americanus]|uniref:uncharacterized protein LOC121869040 n=1 Tax=Homarus americanus TaxID=6706 RepID=UPI001C4444D2|nr:uncharacterized protein LOC121869040 [Homarus americanus]XP_042226067.1 uncharacterized protein LOC121869040 [Homarus americanus]